MGTGSVRARRSEVSCGVHRHSSRSRVKSTADNPPDDEIDVGSDSSTTKRDQDYAAEATDSSGDTASGGGDQPA
jgi:hypothetical protein